VKSPGDCNSRTMCQELGSCCGAISLRFDGLLRWVIDRGQHTIGTYPQYKHGRLANQLHSMHTRYCLELPTSFHFPLSP
jgi:hypothetical protein